jgi:hypothetical protein
MAYTAGKSGIRILGPKGYPGARRNNDVAGLLATFC